MATNQQRARIKLNLDTPESRKLQEDLNRFKARARGARLRKLALLGLASEAAGLSQGEDGLLVRVDSTATPLHHLISANDGGRTQMVSGSVKEPEAGTLPSTLYGMGTEHASAISQLVDDMGFG